MSSLWETIRSTCRAAPSSGVWILIVAAGFIFGTPPSAAVYLGVTGATYLLGRLAFNARVAAVATLLASLSPFARLPRLWGGWPTLSADPIPGLYYFFDASLPILAGSRWNFSQLELLPIVSPVVLFFQLAALAAFLYRHAFGRHGSPAEKMLVVLVLAYPLMVSFVRPSSLNQDALLLAPFYPVAALILSWWLLRLQVRSRLVAGGFLILALGVTAWGSVTLQVFRRVRTEPDPRLLAFLSQRDLRYFHANLWLVERLVPSGVKKRQVESRKSEMAEPRPSGSGPPPQIENRKSPMAEPRPSGSGPSQDRKSQIADRKSQMESPQPAFIAYPDQAGAFASGLEGRYRFLRAAIGSYVVFYDLEPLAP